MEIENNDNIEKIILKRGRPKTNKVKEVNHIRGRIPEKKDKYIVIQNGKVKLYKTIKQISLAYGISESTVYNILTNKITIKNIEIKKNL